MSRTYVAWIAIAAASGVGTIAYLFVTDPPNRPFGVFALVVMAVLFVGLLWCSTWLDPVGGALITVRFRLYHRRVSLGPCTKVVLMSTRNGYVLLGAGPPGIRRRLYVEVLALTQYVERSLEPEPLRLLAETLEHHRASGSRVVAAQLRAQADHVEAGGHARTSPLAALVTYRLPL